MADRLGNILYWIGCIVAVLLFAVGAFVWFNRTDLGDLATVRRSNSCLLWANSGHCSVRSKCVPGRPRLRENAVPIPFHVDDSPATLNTFIPGFVQLSDV